MKAGLPLPGACCSDTLDYNFRLTMLTISNMNRFACVASILIGVCGPHLARAQADGTAAWTNPFVLESGVLSINVASPVVAPDGTVYVGTRGGLVVSGRLWAISPSGSSRFFAAGDWIDATPTLGPDGTIYVGSWDGKFYALRDTGTALTKLWEYSTGSFIYSSAAIGPDGTIYIGAGDSNLHAILPNGTLKWKYPVLDWIDSSPAVAANGNVIVGSWDGNVYAIDPFGNEKWRFTTGAAVLGSPAIAADGTIYIASSDNYLYALNPDGSKRWDYATGADIEGSPALAADGTVYLGSNDGYLYAVRLNGMLAWRTKVGASVASTPAVRADGSIVVGVATVAGASAPGRLVCLNSDGSQKWFYDAFDVIDSSPAIGPENRIYFTDYARRLHALNGTSALADTSWPKWRRDVTHKARMPNDGTLAQLTNLSTRAQVGVGFDILIAGTYVGGGSGKTVLARGVGPELANYDVVGVLADPVLEVYDSDGIKVFENDNWDPALDPMFTQMGAFALDPGSTSAAMLANLSANKSFTFQVKGKNATTGVAIVEIYDAQENSGRLSNLSSRAVVGSGDNVLIPGFYVKGPGPLTLLIRAVGPTLGTLEPPVAGALPQPSIMLVKDTVGLGWNTRWGTAANAAFIKDVTPKVGAFPLADGSADSALLVTVGPGLYSVVVSGVNNTTGIALVELYVVSGY
ncbi:MAG TPA: PQQ-binding-like beta-propeller repeat protein [Opitutaceae bacterium]|nr:PQQ-binding-like beta-propeller repeat protein [Opitutaceae bacterium]